MHTPVFQIDPKSILARAPRIVNSFSDGHWALMGELENEAKSILSREISNDEIPRIKTFLKKVVYLKRPHNSFPELSRRLDESEEEILKAFNSIRKVSSLDYNVFDSIAKIPYFGLTGRRSFASAIMRLASPNAFGIIDWRNLAVLGGCKRFDGLTNPPVTFNNISCKEIMDNRGCIFYDDTLYIEYNNLLRKLAEESGLNCSEIDLVIWVYSLEKEMPIGALPKTTLFESIFVTGIEQNRSNMISKPDSRRSIIDSVISKYLSRMMDDGYQTDDALRAELSAIFNFIAKECEIFSQHKAKTRGQRSNLKDIYDSLRIMARSNQGEKILVKWHNWEDKLSPGSQSYSHLNLPTNMILTGYLVLEDIVDVRKWIESKYDDGSLEPKHH